MFVLLDSKPLENTVSLYNMGKVWFVSPVYNDVPSFKILRDQILKNYPQAQFVILDDTSGQDPQIPELSIYEDVTVVSAPFNLGHQRGLVYCLRRLKEKLSDDDIIITLDSDGEDRPEDIPSLIEKLKFREAHRDNSLVLAQRTKRRENFVFKVFYWFYKRIFNALTGTVIRSGNFAAFYGAFVKKTIDHPHFDLCYSSTLVSLKVHRSFHLCERGERFEGQSKMNFTSLITHGIRMLMPFIDQIAIRSLISFAILFFLSMIAGLTVLWIKLFTDHAIPGWASSLVALFTLMSIVNLGNFLVLFSVYSQSQGLAMQKLEWVPEMKKKEVTLEVKKNVG